jgi:AraC-like DNA-binding protein
VAVRTENVSPFRTVVENAIAPLLPHTEAQAKAVAKRLGLSERTFARRLAAVGLSFGEILDELRRDLAVRYLEEPNLQISQIAWLLGFRQQSAFSHACRRWTGKSPSEHRRSRNRSDAAAVP